MAKLRVFNLSVMDYQVISSNSTIQHNLQKAVSRRWPQLLILLVPALLPLGRMAEIPLACAGIVALLLAYRETWVWRVDARTQLLLTLFLCYWVPALISSIGAVAPLKTGETVLGLLRFLPYGLFCIYAFRNNVAWKTNLYCTAGILVFWLLDAWLQALTGISLGGPGESERLSGIFGADNLKLGPVLATLSPFLLTTARQRYGRIGLGLAFLFLLVPILLAGSRAAWLSFALVGVVFVWRETRTPLRFFAYLGGVTLCVIFTLLVVWRDSTGFDARMQRSLLALQGTFGAVDEAAAGRLRIWRTALAMGAAHPMTGVGVRGFRYAYANYAASDDQFINPRTGEGAAHAHQVLLELWSETGIVGLLGWLIGGSLAIRAWLRANPILRERAFAPGLALIAMSFPLNTHLAFYSAWWGLLFWWLISLYCAAIGLPPKRVEHEMVRDRV